MNPPTKMANFKFNRRAGSEEGERGGGFSVPNNEIEEEEEEQEEEEEEEEEEETRAHIKADIAAP